MLLCVLTMESVITQRDLLSVNVLLVSCNFSLKRIASIKVSMIAYICLAIFNASVPLFQLQIQCSIACAHSYRQMK